MKRMLGKRSCFEMFMHPHDGRVGPWSRYRKPVLNKNFEVPFSTILRNALRDCPSIDINPRVLGGTPRIAGTRIPIFMILDAVEHYGTLGGAVKSYPNLTIEQVKDAVCFAGAVLESPIDYEDDETANSAG